MMPTTCQDVNQRLVGAQGVGAFRFISLPARLLLHLTGSGRLDKLTRLREQTGQICLRVCREYAESMPLTRFLE